MKVFFWIFWRVSADQFPFSAPACRLKSKPNQLDALSLKAHVRCPYEHQKRRCSAWKAALKMNSLSVQLWATMQLLQVLPALVIRATMILLPNSWLIPTTAFGMVARTPMATAVQTEVPSTQVSLTLSLSHHCSQLHSLPVLYDTLKFTHRKLSFIPTTTKTFIF